MTAASQRKLCDSALAATADIGDGASIMVGGFGFAGLPEALIAAVLARGPRNLWLISNNAGNLGKGLETWLEAGLVRKVTCSYPGRNERVHAQSASGALELDVIPQGTLVERIRAAGAGIPAFFTPTGVGTVVAEGKEVRTFEGREYVLERALSADFALIRARRGDAFGNLRFWRTARNFSPAMATAARTTIAEVDALCEIGDLDPDDVHLPGIFIQRIVEVSEHEDPFENRTTRPRERT